MFQLGGYIAPVFGGFRVLQACFRFTLATGDRRRGGGRGRGGAKKETSTRTLHAETWTRTVEEDAETSAARGDAPRGDGALFTVVAIATASHAPA